MAILYDTTVLISNETPNRIDTKQPSQKLFGQTPLHDGTRNYILQPYLFIGDKIISQLL